MVAISSIPHGQTMHQPSQSSDPENVPRCALAIMAVAVALVLRGLLTPLLGENNPYHTV